MSEAATSILLPEARVAVFSTDSVTLEVAGLVLSDWRFARVQIDAQEGDVESAAAYYQEHVSPDLLIVQTDTIDDSFPGKLAALAGVCDEGTAAIVVGPDNDVNLYRRLIDMGVSDYLVRPLEAPVLAEVIAKALIDRLGVRGSSLIAFMGAKGGVGTSALAQAAAWGIADIFGQKTLFIDAAGGWSVSSVGMGFEPVTTLGEAVGAAENEDEDSLERMMFEASGKLTVLANGGEIMLEGGVSASELERLLDYVMAKYPAVVIDLSHAPSALMYTVLSKARQTVLVSNASVSALRLSRSLMQEIGNLRGQGESNVEFILNMSGVGGKNEVSLKDIEKAMGTKPSAVISFLPDLFMGSEGQGKKILDDKEGLALVKSKILPIFQKTFNADVDLTAEVPAQEGLLQGVLKKIKVK